MIPERSESLGLFVAGAAVLPFGELAEPFPAVGFTPEGSSVDPFTSETGVPRDLETWLSSSFEGF